MMLLLGIGRAGFITSHPGRSDTNVYLTRAVPLAQASYTMRFDLSHSDLHSLCLLGCVPVSDPTVPKRIVPIEEIDTTTTTARTEHWY